MKIQVCEKQMIELLNSQKSNICAVWQALLDYYKLKDRLENTRHSDVIAAVYSKHQPTALKHVALSVDLHVSERTLYRYRTEYLNCLAHLLADRGLSLDDLPKLLADTELA